jgi:hypothetical protein
VGYRRDTAEDADGALGGGVVLNPPKSRLLTFSDDDQILVLA